MVAPPQDEVNMVVVAATRWQAVWLLEDVSVRLKELLRHTLRVGDGADNRARAAHADPVM